jgi:tetratricopeptide (TPR) repeat protein
LHSLETERTSLDQRIGSLSEQLPAGFERGSSRSSSRPSSAKSSPQIARRAVGKSKLGADDANGGDNGADSQDGAAPATAASSSSAAASSTAASAVVDPQDLTVDELEKRITETEALNDAVLKQIDSVLDNLGKKVRETEKARMRAVMAALTGENMRCDLDLRVCRRVLKNKTDAIKSKAAKDAPTSPDADGKKKPTSAAASPPTSKKDSKKDSLVKLHRKASYAVAKKDKKDKSSGDDDKLDVQLMEAKEKKQKVHSASTGTVLMQQDATGALSPAMQAEIDRLREAIKATPDDASLHHTLGFSLMRVANDTEGGIEAFKAALAIQPKLIAARIDLGLAYYKLEKWERAAAEYREALASEPDNCIALVNLGNVQRQLGQTRESVTQYERVLELQPKNATAALNLGNAYQTLGDFDRANRMYERVLEIAPSNVYARTKLAEQALEQGKHDLAREHAEKATARDAKNARALAVLGAVFESENKYDEALAQYKLAHAADATNATVCASIGAVMGQLGNAPEAAMFLKKAVQMSPDDAKLLNQLGQWHAKSGATDESRAVFAAAVKRGTAELEQAQKVGGDDAPAVKAARALLANIHSNFGHVLDEADDFGGAQKQYEASLALVKSAATLNKLGACFASQKQMSDAVEQFMAALALAPDEPTVHYNLAAAHAAQGALAEALRHAQTAVLHDENFEAAKTMVKVLQDHAAKKKK